MEKRRLSQDPPIHNGLILEILLNEVNLKNKQKNKVPTVTTTMNSWDDKEIQIARSRGGKISVLNYEDNLVILHSSV
jgi:hypothetical protein